MNPEAAPFNHEHGLSLGPWLRHADHQAACVVLRAREASDEGGQVFEVTARSADGGLSEAVPLLTAKAAAGMGLARVALPGPMGGDVTVEVQGTGGRLVGRLHLRRPEPPRQDGRVAFAFASCFRRGSVRHDTAAWDVIRALAATRQIDHLLLLGDAIYADHSEAADGRTATEAVLALGPQAPLAARLAPLRAEWESSFGQAPVQRALASLPSAATWDDHEIVNGFGSLAWHREPRGLALLEAAAAAFAETLGVGNPPGLVGEKGSGAFSAAEKAPDPFSPDPSSPTPFSSAFRRGPALFVLLDLRTFRDAARGTLLGEAQKRAVEQCLLEEHRDAPLVFLACSVPPLHLSVVAHRLRRASDLIDQWSSDANADERRWLVSLLREVESGGRRRVVLLGGDVHVGTVATLEGGGGLRIHQLTSSPLANTLPWWLPPALALAGNRFPVRSLDEECEGRILHRFRGPNVGVVSGEVHDGRAHLTFELLRPGRRSFRLDLG